MSAASPGLETHPTTPSWARSFVRHAFWPLFFVSAISLMVWADHSGHHDPVRGGLAMATLFGVMLLEQLLPRYADRGIRSDPQLRYDIGFFLGVGLVEALSYGVLLLPVLWLGPKLTALLGTSVWPTHWAWPAQALLAFLAVDLLDYFVHRASHRVPWLWSMHVHHHDTERLHVFKGVRNHPFAPLVRIVGAYLPLVLLGAPPVLLFWFQTFIVSIGSVAHANLDMRFPAWSHLILVTPPVHRVHHARAQALADRNFGALTTLWDRIFGTFEAPDPARDPAFGLSEGGVPKGFLRQLAWPFVWWRVQR
jgi:sterol desaturase/sphingolipid hydroxylase (fatty acid hydroxylase superfamily)